MMMLDSMMGLPSSTRRGNFPTGHSLPKAFYVSPFNGVDGIYRFAVRPPGERVFTGVTLSDSEGPVVTAYFEGKGEALTDGALLRLAVTYPLMTLKVIAGIHWEALRLWCKRVPVHDHPAPRAEPAATTPQETPR